MNRASEIIDYLSNPRTPDMLIVAPKAPPVSRSLGEVTVAIPSVFDAQDVSDTLGAFRTRALASSSDSAMGMTGSFSFGIRDVGRFRVNYATQRGSRILSILRIPHAIPAITSLCEDQTMQERAMSLLRKGGPGLLMICGPNAISNALFAYALIDRVNQSFRKVLYVVERALTFLVKHENSIVIQCESNADVKSMEEGVSVASLFEPDIMYVGDVKPADDLPGVVRAVENGILVILSSVMLNPSALFRRYAPQVKSGGAAAGISANAFTVVPASDGKLTVSYRENVAED
jgi:twitching motility protein PilT